jgi:hypothetical protein
VVSAAIADPNGTGYYVSIRNEFHGESVHVMCSVCGSECNVLTKPLRWLRQVVIIECPDCPRLVSVATRYRFNWLLEYKWLSEWLVEHAEKVVPNEDNAT